MARADRMCYVGWGLHAQWWILCRGYGNVALFINTKVHLYQALVMSVLLYGAETWTLLATDMKTLESFHMRCQWLIQDIRWWAHVSNAEVLQRSGLSAIGDILRHRSLSLFSHVTRLDPRVPSHDALTLMVDIYEGRKPMASWRRAPGRPRNVWLNKVQKDDNCGDLRSPGAWSGATVHSDYTTMMMINVKSCSLSTTNNGDMTHRKQQK